MESRRGKLLGEQGREDKTRAALLGGGSEGKLWVSKENTAPSGLAVPESVAAVTRELRTPS